MDSSGGGDIGEVKSSIDVEAEVSARIESAREAYRADNAIRSDQVNESQYVDVDLNGNAIDSEGRLVVDQINSIDDLTDDDFDNPSRSVELPRLPKAVDEAIGANGKPVVIKKNIFERNIARHNELSGEDSRRIISEALYNPDLYGQNQKVSRPNNWVLIHKAKTNESILLEVNRGKDNVEIVHWHYLDDRGIEKIKRQASREGGQILMLPSASGEVEEAGALSSRTASLSQGKGSENVGDTKSDPSREVTDRGDQVTDPARVVGGRDYKGDEKLGGEQVNEESVDNVGQGVTEEVPGEQAMLGALEELEGRFGVQITVHRDASSIRERSVREAIEAGDTVKGWYNTRDKSVHVYLPQGEGVSDITATYLHEVVAHYGMRELLGEEKYNDFLETLWGKLDAEERSAAMKAANMEGMSADELSRDDIILACDEYVASIAESGDFDGKDRATWRKMVDAMLEILDEFLDSLNVSERDAVSIVEDLLSMSARNLERTSDKGKSRTNERGSAEVASDSRVKVREDGSKDYVGAGVEATIDDLFMETGHDTDVVDSAVQAGISEAEAKVKEAEADFEKRKKKVKGVQGVIALANERKATMSKLEGEVKFWQEVWDRLHPKEEDRGAVSEVRVDVNGNAIDEEGRLVVDRIESIDELTGEDFENPTRSVELPKIPANVDSAIGADGKPVVIKKNIFEKNRERHKFTPEESRAILKKALYDTDLIGQSQPISKPNYWVAIKVDSESPIVILEVNRNKDNVEIVGWYSLDDRNLDRIKRQADREGGELLILSKDTVDSLSTPTADSLPSESKGSDNVGDVQEDGALSDKSDKSDKSDVSDKSEELDVQFRRSINEANSKQKQTGGTKVELDDDVLFRLTKRGKSSVDSWLKKREDLTNEEREAFMQYLEPMDNNLAMATGWWYAKGVIRVPEDQSKVNDAVEVAKRAKVDPLRYGSPMEVLDTFKEYKIKGEAIDPESVPQLSGGRNVGDVSYGIRVYDVEDSKAGQQAMREIINTHWGEDANPWCLLQGDGKGNLRADAWDYWNHYNGVSKRVAFKEGKLLAFCANDDNSDCWWDRQDEPHDDISFDMKIPNDELGREATYEIAEYGYLNGPFDIHRGNKQNGVYEEWDDVGQITVRENYKGGKLEGTREEWYDDGQIMMRENCKNGVRDGLFEQWHYNGILIARGNYKEGMREGLYENWSYDGNLITRGNYKNGKAHGLVEKWDDGVLMSREEYKDDILDGISELYYSNGSLKSRQMYSDGVCKGLGEEWYENGQLKSRVNYNDEDYDGLREVWYDNGQMLSRSNWVNGELDGVYESWYEDGRPKKRRIYKEGELVEDLTDDVRFRRNREELEGIKKRAEAEGRFMKAPNGEATKLNEEQWLEVRSRAFKDWFGDWELPHQEVKVVEAAPHQFKNFNEAKSWAKENIARVYSDEETGGKGEIRISRNAIDKYLSQSAIHNSSSEEVHLSVLKVLPDVIREGVDAETHLDYLKGGDGVRSPEFGINKGVMIHRVYSAVELSGELYRVKVTLKMYDDLNTPGKPHSYEAIKIELLKGTLVDTNSTNPSNSNSISVAKLLKDVEKSYEKGKYLLDDYSKMVDENGEPMVFYHNTDADFTVFDSDKNGTHTDAGWLGDGFYFYGEPSEGDGYGKNKMATYLNIREPYYASSEENSRLAEADDRAESIAFREQLEEDGYDGVYYDGDLRKEAVVFNANQIKSATDNMGSFSGESDDIRFRRGKVTEEMDTEYMEAVKSGDMEAAQRLVNEAAKLNGYDVSSEYQGTSAFNGSAPYGNDYFSSKEERKAAFENDEFEGDTTLGDYIDSGIDPMNLDLLLNQRSYQHADAYRKEAISNIKDVIRRKSKTIKMYRSVPNDVQEGSFRNGDWITPSKGYAEKNADVHGWGDNYRIIEQEVPIDEVWFDGNDIAEFGYGREQDFNEDTDFAYKNTRNNKKLLSPIVYNDNGEVIPLSQRFNEEVADVRFRRGRDIGAVNERFNEELREQIAGKQKAGHVYQLGMPSDVLRSAGVPDLPIELVAERLLDKSRQDNHPFELSEVTNLPKSVQDPLAVFRSATRVGSFVVLTELKHGDKSYVVAIEANKKVGRLQVNSIRSVHYRSSEMHIVNWINDGLAEYISPVFTSNWFNPMKKELTSKRQYNSADVRDKLLSATKVVKDFENPKLEGSDVRFRRGGDELKKREGEGLGEYAERIQRYHEANGRIGEASRVGEKPVYKGGSIGEYAREVTAYNDDPRVLLRGVGSVSIPKAPEVTSKMSIADVAKEMNDYHHRVREVNKRLEEDMRKCRSVSGRFKYNFVDRAAALETFNESMRASGIEVPPELDAYSDMMRSAGMSNIQLDKARFDVLNPLEEELSKHSKEINDSDTFKGLRLEFRDKETGELMCEENRDLRQKTG